jgi:hypothetical protein
MCTNFATLGFTCFMFKSDKGPQTNGSYAIMTIITPEDRPVTTSDSVNDPTPIAVEVVGNWRSLFKEFFAYGCPGEWQIGHNAGYCAIMWFSVITGALFALTEMYMSSRWFEIQPLANGNALVVIASSICDIIGACFASKVVVSKFKSYGHFFLLSTLFIIGGLNLYLGSATNIFCAYGAYLAFVLLKRICRSAGQQYVSFGLKGESTQEHTTVTMSKFNSLGMMVGFFFSLGMSHLFAKLKSKGHPLSMVYHLCGFFYLVAFALFSMFLLCYRKTIQKFMNALFTGQKMGETNDVPPESV